jgi:formate dehydrogenase alpha subunit
MKEITLTINGRQVKGEEGDTVLNVCKANGIYVPTLCHKDGLSDVGACRMCVVEIERERRVMPACTYPVRDGLAVKTHTERLERYRRLLLELILSEHEHNCLVCEKNGNCELQNLVYQYGIDKVSFPINKSVEPIDDSSAVISRDPNKCILCGRCVRACAEIAGQGILNFANRGNKTVIVADLSWPLGESNCVSCGACIQACPTGTLSEKLARFQGRSWEFRKVQTTCPYCGVGCQIELNIKDLPEGQKKGAKLDTSMVFAPKVQRIVKVYGVEDAPYNQGNLCVKGRFGFDYVNHPDRLTTPLIKRDGKFEQAGWDEALDLIATRFKELKDKYGSNALAGLSSAKCTNEENYLFQKFVRTCFATNNVDHCARLCHAPSVTGLVQTFGSGAMTNSISEIRDAACILAIGTNTTETHPIIGREVKRAVENGAKLIVANPREISLCRFSSLWLQHSPGADVALLMGMMRVIVDEGLFDSAFIKERCENFDAFKESLNNFELDFVESVTKVPRDKIVEAARMFATNSPATILYAMGITQSSHGTDNVVATANLAMLTGNVGKPSTGVNPLRGQNNVQGACDMGALPNVYPGYQAVADPAIRDKFEFAWGCSLPSSPGLTVIEMLEAAYRKEIKALYLMGENPALSDPDIGHAWEALAKLEFLVVQDIFFSETAKFAHVVLPAASFAEKDGTFTNTERRVQRVRKAIEPIGDSKPDWWIICQVAKRLVIASGEATKQSVFDYSHPFDIMEEIRELTPSYGGISYQRLENGGLQWPCPTDDHPGTPILHVNTFVRGKGRFIPLKYIPPKELPDEEYPLILTTGRSLYHYHTGTMTRKSAGLNIIEPEGTVEINPRDALQLGITQGDKVKVSSRRGEVITKAEVTQASPPGVIFMTFHFAESPANALTNSALDPVAKIPEYKVCAAKLEKMNKVRS